ncbi:MAG: hypothetical protein LBM09_01200 [Candidatus Nomurabacteria bacterium]|jgi:hypothetical protein|nr:hypothetical protein [Candidatus Nomurabacteria bacterium]
MVKTKSFKMGAFLVAGAVAGVVSLGGGSLSVYADQIDNASIDNCVINTSGEVVITANTQSGGPCEILATANKAVYTEGDWDEIHGFLSAYNDNQAILGADNFVDATLTASIQSATDVNLRSLAGVMPAGITSATAIIEHVTVIDESLDPVTSPWTIKSPEGGVTEFDMTTTNGIANISTNLDYFDRMKANTGLNPKVIDDGVSPEYAIETKDGKTTITFSWEAVSGNALTLQDISDFINGQGLDDIVIETSKYTVDLTGEKVNITLPAGTTPDEAKTEIDGVTGLDGYVSIADNDNFTGSLSSDGKLNVVVSNPEIAAPSTDKGVVKNPFDSSIFAIVIAVMLSAGVIKLFTSRRTSMK